MKDKYLYSETNVLVNKLNITDENLLKEAEANIVPIKLMMVEDILKEGKNDFGKIKEIHKFLFEDIYEFAGETREINIEKAERVLSGLSVEYCDYSNIENEARNFFNDLNKVKWDMFNINETVEKFSNMTARLWNIHPFREGNTRTVITFMLNYAESKGIKIDRTVFNRNTQHLRDSLVLYSIGEYSEPQYLQKIIKDSLGGIEMENKKLDGIISIDENINNLKIRDIANYRDALIHYYDEYEYSSRANLNLTPQQYEQSLKLINIKEIFGEGVDKITEENKFTLRYLVDNFEIINSNGNLPDEKLNPLNRTFAFIEKCKKEKNDFIDKPLNKNTIEELKYSGRYIVNNMVKFNENDMEATCNLDIKKVIRNIEINQVKERILDSLTKNSSEDEFNKNIEYINRKYGDLDKFTKEYIKESEEAKKHGVEFKEVNSNAVISSEISVIDAKEVIDIQKETDFHDNRLKRANVNQERTIKGEFNEKHIKKINMYLTEGNMVLNEDGMEKFNEVVAKPLKREKYLRGMDVNQVSTKLAEYYLKIDETKPFQEGNISTAKQFIKELASKNGYEIDFNKGNFEGKISNIKEVNPIKEIANIIKECFTSLEPNKDLAKEMDKSIERER